MLYHFLNTPNGALANHDQIEAMIKDGLQASEHSVQLTTYNLILKESPKLLPQKICVIIIPFTLAGLTAKSECSCPHRQTQQANIDTVTFDTKH